MKPKASDDKSNAHYHADELWVKLKVYLTTTVDGQSPTNLTSKCKDFRQLKKELHSKAKEWRDTTETHHKEGSDQNPNPQTARPARQQQDGGLVGQLRRTQNFRKY